jgi:hypothetical protein
MRRAERHRQAGQPAQGVVAAPGGARDLDRANLPSQRLVAADMITVMVGVEDMRDLSATLCRLRQQRPGHRRVDDANRAALGLAYQPHVIVVQDQDTDDV